MKDVSFYNFNATDLHFPIFFIKKKTKTKKSIKIKKWNSIDSPHLCKADDISVNNNNTSNKLQWTITSFIAVATEFYCQYEIQCWQTLR